VTSDYSARFYPQHARRYAEVAHGFVQSQYVSTTHPELKDDLDLMRRLKGLVPRGAKGLDAGCGSGARDVFYYWRDGYDILGIDAIRENIDVAKTMHPEIADRVAVADLTQPLTFVDGTFDFVLCNAVIQHISPDAVTTVTLPELVRVLIVGGVLQLMFKTGQGVRAVYDRDFEAQRAFHLYEPAEVVGRLGELGLEVVAAEEGSLGGLILFNDTKPMEHGVLFARKVR
jgi:SAM-dependent methyltransferase